MTPAAAPAASAETARRALQRLSLSGVLRTVDIAFAELLERLGAGAEVALAGALAMRVVAQGDSGFALDRGDALLAALEANATLPEPAAWRVALQSSPLVAPSADDPDHRDVPAALLVFEHGRVALRRYARYEHDLARRLLARAASSAVPMKDSTDSGTPTVAGAQPAAVAPCAAGDLAPGQHPQTLADLHRLFAAHGGDAGGSAPAIPLDQQALAAWLSLRRHLLLLTGGPGTGKTTTVARLLALAVADAAARGAPAPRIALAAPTGRAAVRLAEAVGAQLARDLDDGRLAPWLAEAVPRQASTLHRLLGVRPGSVAFRHDARRPLPFDLVVVDEASMIDLPLMDKLVAAVAPRARLVLIGDPDQLPAVEAGDVLGALCAAAGDGLAWPADDAAAASAALRTPVPALAAGTAPDAPLAGARVHLLRGWRQAGAEPLQAFAAAVRAGDADSALTLLADAANDDDATLLHRHGDAARLAAWLRECALPLFEAVRDADSPEQALTLARRLRLLTALRRGPFGADTWNAWCAAELGARGRWFHGALIAIAANSPQHGLFNGDLGVIRREHDGSLMAWFGLPDPETGLRWRCWRPAQLPEHGLAFAGTVHKAQGSEFDRVVLILPDRDSRALSRELLYTAATRARRGLWLWGAPDRLREAIARRSTRESGLLARLRAGG